MPTEIDSLEVKIKSDATQAVSGIDALSKSLADLKTAVGGGLGLRAIANQVSAIGKAGASVPAESPQKIERLANALSKLSSIGNLKISSTIARQLEALNSAVAGLDVSNVNAISTLANGLTPLSVLPAPHLNTYTNQLKKLPEVMTALNGADIEAVANKIKKLSDAVSPMSTLGKQNISPFFNQLKKLPEVARQLEGVDLDKFTSQIKRLTDSLTPLATQMDKVGKSFANFPSKVNQVSNATQKAANQTQGVTAKYTEMWSKFNLGYLSVKGLATAIAHFINESNEYVESLNLFNASMGSYAEEAKNYADQVSGVLGIDPAEWMKRQGAFNSIIKGFGVVEEKASLMSQNLTQLGYDISSYANIPVESAMLKVQSGISGELEPLRALGYDLSVARLQQEALNLGIDKSVISMTQAEKAQLRYYTTMKQMTWVQGDMARTLEAPANQLRVFRAQLQMTARSIGNIFIPALNLALPYLIAFTQMVRKAADLLANLVGFTLPEIDYSGIDLSGVTTELPEGLEDAADAADGVGKNLKDATKPAKELKKSIMGFDELNLLNDNSQDLADDLKDVASGLGDLGSGGLGGGGLDIPLPTYDFLKDAANARVEDAVQKIKDFFNEVGVLLTGVGLIVIGLVLIAFGHPFLGAGAIAAGASELIAAEHYKPGILKDQLSNLLHSAYGVFSGLALVAMGLLVMASGHFILGIGLIVAGAAVFAVSASYNKNVLNDTVAEVFAAVAFFSGIALVSIGILLLGNPVWLPIGVAMIAAGAALLFTAIALDYTQLGGTISDTLAKILTWTSVVMVTLGVILILTGVPHFMGVGIFLLATGVASMFTAIAQNHTAVMNAVGDFFTSVAGMFEGVALGVIGVILLAHGMVPLGVALVAAGFVSFVISASANWDTIVNLVSNMLAAVGASVGGALMSVGLIMLLNPASVPLGISMIAAGALTFASGVALGWDELDSNIKTMLATIGTVGGLALMGLGLVLLLFPATVPLGVGMIGVGGVVSFNVAQAGASDLPDRVRSLLQLVAAVSGVLLMGLGMILLITQQYLVGIAMVVAGGASLYTAAQLDNGGVYGMATQALKKIGFAATGTVLLGLGMVLLTTGNIPLGLGMVLAGATGLFKAVDPDFSSFTEIGQNIVEAIKSGGEKAWEAFKTAFHDLFQNVVEAAKDVFGIHSPSKVFESIGNNLVQGFEIGVRRMRDVVSNLSSVLQSMISSLISNMSQWGRDMGNNLTRGFREGIERLKEYANDAQEWIKDRWHFSVPDKGPWADADTWMPDFMQLLAEGIRNNRSLVEQEMLKLQQGFDMSDSLDKVVSNETSINVKAPQAAETDNGSVTEALISALNTVLNDNDGEQQIIVNIGDEELTDYVIRGQRRLNMRSGSVMA